MTATEPTPVQSDDPRAVEIQQWALAHRGPVVIAVDLTGDDDPVVFLCLACGELKVS